MSCARRAPVLRPHSWRRRPTGSEHADKVDDPSTFRQSRPAQLLLYFATVATAVGGAAAEPGRRSCPGPLSPWRIVYENRIHRTLVRFPRVAGGSGGTGLRPDRVRDGAED